MNRAERGWSWGGGGAFKGLCSRFAGLFFLAFVMSVFNPPKALYAQTNTEFGAEDDLSVLGVDGTDLDPDLEVKGFSVFGSTQPSYAGLTHGPGSVVINGQLWVASGTYFSAKSTFTAGMYVSGISTFTDVGNLYIPGGAANQVLSWDSDGSLKWATLSTVGGGGDNLGSHVATKTLDMGNYGIVNAGSITASSGSFVNGVYVIGVSTLAGNVFVNGVSSFTGTVSMSKGQNVYLPAAANLYMGDGAADQVLAWDSDGSLKWSTLASLGSGDDLGSHIATQTLDMAGYGVTNVGSITASSATITGNAFSVGDSTFSVFGGSVAIGAVAGASTPAGLYVVGSSSFIGTGYFNGTGSVALWGKNTDRTQLGGQGAWIRLQDENETDVANVSKVGLLASYLKTGASNHSAWFNKALAANAAVAAGTLEYLIGTDSRIEVTGGNLTNAYNFYAAKQSAAAGASVLANRFGLYVADINRAVTDQYGVYIADLTNGANSNYGVYSAGGKNYFAGPIRTDSNITASSGTFVNGLYSMGVSTMAGTMYVNGVSSFTAAVSMSKGQNVYLPAAANLYMGDGAANQVLAWDADGSLKWSTLASLGSGDDLGSHVATKTLDMANFGIIGIASASVKNNLTVVGTTTLVGVTGAGYVTVSSLTSAGHITASSGTFTALYVPGVSTFTGTHYVNGVSSFTAAVSMSKGQNVYLPAAANLYMGDGAANQVLTWDTDGSLKWDTLSSVGGGGDNLGSHVATKTLDMGGFGIKSVGSLTASSATITGDDGGTYGMTVSSNVSLGGVLYTAGGKVGIGDAGPSSRLQIGGATADTGNQITLGKYAASSENFLPVIQQASIFYPGTGNDLALGAGSNSGGIVFYTGGTATQGQLGTNSSRIRVAINNIGNIGLGTTEPMSKLQVGSTTADTSNQITFGKYDTSSESFLPVIQQKSVLQPGAGNDLALGANSINGGIVFYTGVASGQGQLGTNSNRMRMAINSAGDVGISTGVPQGRLDVMDDGNTATDMVQLWRNSDGVIKGSMSATGVMMATKFLGDGSSLTGVVATKYVLPSSMTLTGNDGTYGLTVSSNVSLAGALYTRAGKVGVGKSSPGSALDVNGNVTASSGTFTALYVPGVSTFTGTMYVNGVSSFTNAVSLSKGQNVYLPAAANLYMGDGAANQVLAWDADGSLKWSSLSSLGSGDDLGSHIATQTLNMADYDIVGVSTLTVSSITTTAEGVAISTNLYVMNGKVGIGTKPSEFIFEIASDDSSSTAEADIRLITHSDNPGESDIILVKTRSNGAIVSGDRLGSLYFEGHDGTDDTTQGARIQAYSEGTIATDRIPANIRFYTHPDSTDPIAERMRIDSAGNIGIGTATPQGRLDVKAVGLAATDMAQLWRASDGVVKGSMSATGVMMATKFIGDGSALTNLNLTGAGDNLGNHVATTTLQMGAYGINTSSDISAAHYQIYGSTVLAITANRASIHIGIGAGAKSVGAYNVFIGSNAGSASTTNTGNTLIGFAAGEAHYGYSATFVGYGAGNQNTNGYQNTFIGMNAGQFNTTGKENTVLGVYASRNNVTGGSNTISGTYAGWGSITGSNNAIFGSGAGYGVSGQSYSSSTVIGSQAGYSLGSNADNNLLLGFQAGYSIATGTGNIVLGSRQDTSANNANNELNIGGTLFGDLKARTIGISTRAPQAALDVVSTGTTVGQMAQLWRNSDGVIKGSMSATGVMMATKFIGDGSALTNLNLTGAGDDLGDHVATTTLNMANFGIVNSGSITASSLTVTGNSGIAITAAGARLLVSGGTGTYGYMNGGNSDTAPWLATLNNTDPGSATYGWQFYNNATNGNLDVYRNNASTTKDQVLSFERTTGNVGVSTNAPQARLDVKASGTSTTDMAQIWRASDGVIKGSMSATGVMMATKFLGDGSSLTGVVATKFVLPSSMTLTGNDGTYGLTVSSNVSLGGALYTAGGKVGIGTSGPSSLLHLNSAATTSTTIGVKDSRIILQNNSFTVGGGGEVVVGAISDTDIGRYAAIGTDIQSNTGGGARGALYLATKALPADTALTPRLYVQPGGNVGINNSLPAYKLDVTGGGHFTSSMTVDGNIYGLGVSSFTGGVALTKGQNVYLPAAANLYMGDGAVNQVLAWDADGSLKWSSLSSLGSGDDLGSHVATKTLDMGTFGIVNAGSVTASSLTVTGNAFSVGAGTFSVFGGSVAVGAVASASTPAGLYVVGSSSFVGSGYFGYGAATTPQLTVHGGSGGSPIITLQRTSGANVKFSWALAGGGLSFSDDVNGGVVTNMFGDNNTNALYVGQRWKITDNTKPSLLSAETINSGTDKSGPNFTIRSGLGTGAGTPGHLYFNTGIVGVSGTAVQSDSTKMTILYGGNVGISTGVPQGRLDVMGGGTAATDMVQIWRNSGGTIVSSMSAAGVMMANKFIGDGLYVTGSSTFTDVGNVYISGGSANQVLTWDSDGSLKWDTLSSVGGGGDNLGSHVATKTLDMGNYGIVRAGSITASSGTFVNGLYVTNVSTLTGTLYANGVSSFTNNVSISKGRNLYLPAAANLYMGDGAANQVLAWDADGSLKWASVSSLGSGDNLGSHIATQTLNMDSFPVIGASSVTIAGTTGLLLDVSATESVAGSTNTAQITLTDTTSGALPKTEKFALKTYYNKTGNSTHSAESYKNGGIYTLGSITQGTVQHMMGVYSALETGGTGSPSNLYNFYASSDTGGGGGTVGARSGLFVKDLGRALTTQYGVYIENLVSGSNNYGIYSVAGKNYFGGNITASSGTFINGLYVTGVSTLTGTMYVNGISSFTNTVMMNNDKDIYLSTPSRIHVTGGAANQVLTNAGNNSLKWADVSSLGGDNLGNHTATTDLNMSSKDIVGVKKLTVSSITTTEAAVTFSTNVYLASPGAPIFKIVPTVAGGYISIQIGAGEVARIKP